MQTRRSKKAVEEPAPSSSPPQPIRRNPPRATKRRGNEAVDRESSSSPSPPPSSSPTRPTTSLLLPPAPAPPPPSSLPSRPLPPATPSHSSPVLPSIEPPKGLTSVPRKGSIVFDPKPRRGAPRHLSVSSIATNPRRDNTDDEYDEDDESIAPEPKSAAQLLEEEMVQRDIEEAEHEIKLEAVPSLARDAKNLIGQLQNKSRSSYEKVLLMKLQSFRASRSIFQASHQASPFLDWDWVDKAGEDMPETENAAIPLSIKLANIATALMQIESIESEGDNPVPFLEAVDTLFPLHFAAEETQYRSMSLEIRTQRAIESIARSPQATDLRGMLGHAFCNMNAPDAPGDYGSLFSKGPYKPLADLDQQSLVDVCSQRVSNMWKIMSDGGKRGIRTPVDLPSIRAQYSLKETLNDLKEWLMDRYSTISHLLSRAEQEKVALEKERLREQWRAEEQRLFREQRKVREEAQHALEDEHRAREQQQRAKEEELRAREEAQQAREREQQAREAARLAQERENRAREAAKQVREREKERQARQDRARKADKRGAREEKETYPDLPPLGDENSYPDHDSFDGSSQDLNISQPEPPPQRFKSRDRDSSLFMGRKLIGLLGGVSLTQLPPKGSSRKRSYQQSEDLGEVDDSDDNQQAEEESYEEEEEEEEEDDFEVDSRSVRGGKAAASSIAVHQHRKMPTERDDGRNNVAQEEQRAIKRSKTASSAAPVQRSQEQQVEYRRPTASTSTARSPPSVPPSATPDFAAIQRVKDQARMNARLTQPKSLKKRFVWSDRDSATLVDLVARRAAGWATIEREDSQLFELPRNAQAYRDRARNMKVDFLISDAVLPQGFDLVTLSKKEIDRLQKLGKNPARRERDVDRNGKPTNTKADMAWLED
ncbi:hypothetical protein GGI42DRAFT_247209 [Trichoderma sp. SZMC 28013]